MKKVMAILSILTLGSLCACTPMPSSSGTPEPELTQKPEKQAYYGNSYIQYPDIRDYTYSWWENGFSTDPTKKFCVQTGYYGLSLECGHGMLNRIGAIKEEIPQSVASKQDVSVINPLHEVKTNCSFTYDGKSHERLSIQPPPTSDLPLRMIESGQYMQSFDTSAITFFDSDILGRIEMKCSLSHIAVNFELFSEEEIAGVKFDYTLKFSENPEGVLSADGKELLLKFSDGSSLAFCIPTEGFLQYAEGTVTVSCNNIALEQYEFGGFGVIIIPSSGSGENSVSSYKALASVTGTAEQIAPKEGKNQKCEFDPGTGVMVINTDGMNTASAAAIASEKTVNANDRLLFTLTNPSSEKVKVPVMFLKERVFAVEGFAPMIRNAETGEPTGLQVQITKNWHYYDSKYSRQWYYEMNGKWYHGFTCVEIPANSSVTYEYTVAINTWGFVNTASHAQLCLIGWPNGNTQIWHTSTIGCSGESYCYDPDGTCGYSFINDVRGVGFDMYENGGTYGWGANCGGGNMLYYGKNGPNPMGSKSIVGLKNVKVTYKVYGPNLTEITFNGITKDNAAEVSFTSYLPRTNDMSRVVHSFKYTFLKDVTFERMAFYQIGGDNHNSGRWHGITLGNNDGYVEYTLDGKTYGAEAELPVSGDACYIGGSMQRIEVPGEGLWIGFTDSYIGINSDAMQGKTASRTLNLLEFSAELNGVHYDKPAVNFRNTVMFCGDSNLVELCPPAAVGNTIKAGSTVSGAVSYMNLPVSLKSFYYTSDIIKNLPEDEFDTWKMAYRYAMGTKTAATAVTGEITAQNPIRVKCASGDVLAEINIKGGISYLPITFTGVPVYYGIRLEKKNGDVWEKVDQSNYGNDYWQTYYNPETEDYELTFNVEHSGDLNAVYSYRLVKY